MRVNSFIQNLAAKSGKLLSKHIPTDYGEVLNYFITLAQQEDLWEVKKQLRRYGHVSQTHEMAKLKPFLDDKGIVRIGSRLPTETSINYNTQYPILLPRIHPLTKLIVLDIHTKKLKHIQGTMHTLSKLNETYWIFRGKNLVRKWIEDCLYCKRKTPKPLNQVEGPLPYFRIPDEQAYPFKTTMIDCAGPINTVIGRGRSRQKRYILIFICTQVRAIHLEVLTDLSTDKFLLALSRFLARRPRPKTLLSDRGRNFIGGSQVLKMLWDNLKEDRVRSAYPEIRWLFLPPFSPQKGGLHERMIGCVKRAMERVLPHEDSLTDEDLMTTMCEIENIMNSRPISPAGDHADLEPLTPAHFLVGNAIQSLAPWSQDDLSAQKRWFKTQALVDRVWKRLKSEVIPELNKYHQRMLPQRNLKEGDIVMLSQDIGRADWSIGKVIKVYPNSSDGKV